MYSLSLLLFYDGFKIQNSVCNGCDNLTMLCLNITNFAIITVKDVDYCCIIHDSNRSEANNLLENSVLDDRWHI